MNENNNLNTNNDEVNSNLEVKEEIVVPIHDVKIEDKSNDLNNDDFVPIKSTKNSKLSTILLVLLFLFLFTFVMALPEITTFINNLKADRKISEIQKETKSDEKQQQEQIIQKPLENNKEELKELICTLNNNENQDYNLVQIQKFYYNSNYQVSSSKNIYQYTFNTIDDYYNQLKIQCDEDSLKYISHDGYTIFCSYGDTNIQMGYEFDLKTFTPIVDENTNIQANANFNENVNNIKNNLISQGYTCE